MASSAQHMLEHAQTPTAGVGGLGHLGQLERITQQDQVLRRPGCRQGVGQGQLPASSTIRTSTGASFMSLPANSQVVPATRLNSLRAHGALRGGVLHPG